MDAMNKEKFLTVRWNNLIALGLGIPALILASVVIFTPAISDLAGFIALMFVGVLY
jgi:hypothetical protein